ncbi:MAG: DUF5818 domain-containing protein [Candidatus Sulfotelmatobacter sp.]
MKRFLLRFMLAGAVTLAAIAIAPASDAQSGQAPVAASGQQQQPNDAQMPAQEPQTQDAQTFNGRIVKENGQLVLRDPVAKVSYKLDDQSKAKQYMGKKVKVTGKLDMNSNTIHIDNIELLS